MTLDILRNLTSDPVGIILVVVFFGVSIFVHELGHYLVARWRGLKVDRFSIGFGPRLFGWRDRHGVDWRVSLFPLGGYVALPQLADMRAIEGASEAEASKLPPISYSDKMWTSVAGAVFNLIFALFLGTILFVRGLPVSEAEETTVVGYVIPRLPSADGDAPSPAAAAGIQPGDRIIAVDGQPVSRFEDIVYAITTGTERTDEGLPQATLVVERAGDQVEIVVRPSLSPDEGLREIGIVPASSLVIADVFPNSPAALAGLQGGDAVVALNDQPLYEGRMLTSHIAQHPEDALTLSIRRGDTIRSVSLRPESVVVDSTGRREPLIGIRWLPQYTVRHIDPFTQIARSVETTFEVLAALIHPRSNVGIHNLSGPVGISYTLYAFSQISLLQLLSIVVLINVNLAILNLLPIPVLDGGHMLFATAAKLRGRPLPPRWIAGAQASVMVLLLGMMLYVTFFDIGRVGRFERERIESQQEETRRVDIIFTGESMRDVTPPQAVPSPD